MRNARECETGGRIAPSGNDGSRPARSNLIGRDPCAERAHWKRFYDGTGMSFFPKKQR